jgi:hypothetical protein
MHEAEKKILITRNHDLQQELEALKVCVVYIGSFQSTFSSCCFAPGMSLKFVVKIEGGDM